MANISWLPSFETGIPDIDNDHRKLFESIGKMEEALESEDFESCVDMFNDFLKQAADHFKREEAFLISIDFPRVESHAIAHKQLLEMGAKIQQTAEKDLKREEAQKCLEEIIYFLLEDIIKADAEFKSYAQENGII